MFTYGILKIKICFIVSLSLFSSAPLPPTCPFSNQFLSHLPPPRNFLSLSPQPPPPLVFPLMVSVQFYCLRLSPHPHTESAHE